MADQYSQDGEPLDIFGSDPFGRNYLYGLSGNGDGLGLQPPAQGLPVDTRPYDRMQATPRGFISGLFSDVLGGALNMPNLQMTGVPSLDLLYANRNPLMKLMGVGDVQKTAERISYGEPLTTGAGMTLRPRDETIGAALTVAPFVGEAASFGSRVGRAGARMVGERMAENVAMGRPNLPSMFAEPKASLFAVEPSPMAAPKPQAPVSELGFYSAAEQAALNLPRNKGTGQAFLNDLMKAPDVKKDELAWTGLDDFLKEKPNVTKQEVQDFIANNKVDLQEVRLGESPVEDPIGIAKRKAVFDKYEPEIQQLYSELDNVTAQKRNALKLANAKYDEMLYQLNKDGYMPTAQDYEAFNLAEKEVRQANRMQNDDIDIRNRLGKIQNMRDAEANAAYVVPETMPTKYSKYQLAGGENYREILLKLPKESPTTNDIATRLFNKEMRFLSEAEKDAVVAEARRIEDTTPKDYVSSHFNEPNILAHMRVNDRIDADGKKMLLVEEIQSDWHQAGRERGYASKESLEKWYNQNKLESDPVFSNLNSEQIRTIERNRSAGMGGESVPDAPFKDTWYQLALKRIMKYAADNGYERVGLTTGKQQADRYKLSNEVDEINIVDRNYMTTGEKIKQVALDMKSGQSLKLGVNKDEIVIDVSDETIQNFMGKKLSEVVGKDIAKEIMTSNKKTISGEGLDIGGQGMKKYYDEIYPKFLEKYGKKWDAGVGETTIATDRTRDAQGIPSMYPTKEPIRYIDITPKMKESVGKGQPLFTAIPAGTLGLGGLEYADPFASPLTEDTTR